MHNQQDGYPQDWLIGLSDQLRQALVALRDFKLPEHGGKRLIHNPFRDYIVPSEDFFHPYPNGIKINPEYLHYHTLGIYSFILRQETKALVVVLDDFILSESLKDAAKLARLPGMEVGRHCISIGGDLALSTHYPGLTLYAPAGMDERVIELASRIYALSINPRFERTPWADNLAHIRFCLSAIEMIEGPFTLPQRLDYIAEVLNRNPLGLEDYEVREWIKYEQFYEILSGNPALLKRKVEKALAQRFMSDLPAELKPSDMPSAFRLSKRLQRRARRQAL
jgi:hypothetical protein